MLQAFGKRRGSFDAQVESGAFDGDERKADRKEQPPEYRPHRRQFSPDIRPSHSRGQGSPINWRAPSPVPQEVSGGAAPAGERSPRSSARPNRVLRAPMNHDGSPMIRTTGHADMLRHDAT